MATTSQVTDIRTTDKTHTASGEKREERKKKQVSCLPERSQGLESCSDSCDISQHTGHYKINEAPLNQK